MVTLSLVAWLSMRQWFSYWTYKGAGRPFSMSFSSIMVFESKPSWLRQSLRLPAQKPSHVSLAAADGFAATADCFNVAARVGVVVP